MPWDTRDTMSLRREFILLAMHEGANRRELCRRFGISPKTACKWLARYAKDSERLQDRSRRPLHSPSRTAPGLEAVVLALRRQHPAWGGRKISKRLEKLGCTDAPAASTVTSILHRHGLLSEAAGICFPLTMIDDQSRFNLVLAACAHTNTKSVQLILTETFHRYGLLVRINADNDAPWGSPSEREHGITRLTVWLIRLGIRISHSALAHPQTNGKDERFHRLLKAEVLNGRSFHDLEQVQRAFDDWRHIYNEQRPHEALDFATAITQLTNISSTTAIHRVRYGPNDIVVEVGWTAAYASRGEP